MADGQYRSARRRRHTSLIADRLRNELGTPHKPSGVSMISRTRAAALILALPVLPIAAQRPAPAQRGGAPRAETPQLVVGVLASRDPAFGVLATDAIRRRIQNEHNATDLYVVPRPKIEQTLRSAGYNPDSTLGTSDLMALAKQVRGD